MVLFTAISGTYAKLVGIDLQIHQVQSDNYGGRWATIMMAGEGVAE